MKREEAIQILETQFPHDSVIREALATVIPEFQVHESEDERIIREMLEYFIVTRQSDFCSHPERQAWITYLEKQKEPKELPLMDGNADLYFDEWNQQQQNPTKRQCFEEGVRYAQRLQKEQKPISFSEPYNPDEYEVAIEGNATSLKRKKQKPVMGNGIFEQTKMNETVYKFTPEEWKKALDEQLPKEQKPVELNEEDDKLRYYVYEAVQARYSDRELSKYLDPKIIGEKIELRRKIFAFLRNLGPSWKPTAEQMEALETAERWYSDNMGCNYALVSLCEQLRKLRYGCTG